MAWLDDFSFDVSTGNVRHVSGTTRYHVNNMHRGLMSLVYQPTKSGNDLLDITDLFVPSKRNSDTDIELLGTVNIDATAAEFMFGGSITYGAGTERYSGLAIAGSFNANALPQVFQNNTKLTNYWGFSFSPDAGLGYACRILVKSMTAGALIDGGRVRVQSRGYGYQYREGSTVLGRNESVAAVGAIASDSFNSVALATIATYTDITNTQGYQTVNYNNGNGAQPYYSQWTKGTRAKGDVYNRIKYETRDGSASTLYGLNGELYRGATHSIVVNTPTGTMVEPETLTWTEATEASSGQLLAIDSTTAGTICYIQLLTGIAPTNGTVLTGGTGTLTTGATVTTIPLGGESVSGNYTGSWIGARGVAMAIADVSSTDSFTDLLGAPQSPPNNQSVRVTGLVATEDYVIVGKSIDGGISINKSEYTAAVGNNLGNGTIVVNEAITNIPAAGTVRIFNGVGDDKYTYTSYSGSTFTISGTLSQSYTSAVNVYPTIIDKIAGSTLEQNTWVYTVDTDLAGQVIDSGGSPTKQFPIAGAFTASGYSVNVVRTPDV